MKKIVNRIKKRPILVSTLVFSILFLLSSVCLIYSILRVDNIENLLRYIFCVVIFLSMIYALLQAYTIINRAKNVGIILNSILLIALFIVESYACSTINEIYNSVDKMYKDEQTYTTSLISLSNNTYSEIKDLKDLKIGMINDESSIDGHIIPKETIEDYKLKEKNSIVEYDGLSRLIGDLYNRSIDLAFVPSEYIAMFSATDEYKKIATDTKVIFSNSKTVKKDEEVTVKSNDEPFTILILGIDSIYDDISKVTAFNADSIMLVTFNPKTYNSTIISIPRDTYVPIACIKNKPSSKITHSGWNGESCVVSTLEEFLNIKIDYYVKVNFTGVVNLVDALGGIEVDVPYSFCEQNSKREWGNKTVYVKKGLQNLTGEQALALSRNRHPNPGQCSSEWTNYYTDDIIRGQNQQLIINALLNKVVNNMNLDKIYSVLDVVGKNIDTNMQVNEMTSYYNLIKEISLNSLGNNNSTLSFERLYLSTYGKTIYDPLMNLPLSNQVYYLDSFNAIKNEMQVNLGLIDPAMIKNVKFSINDTYTPTTIGKGTFNQSDIETVPYFIGKDVSIAREWAKSKNIEFIIEYEEVTVGVNNSVLSQSIPSSYIVSNITGGTKLKVKISKLINTTPTEPSTSNEENNIIE